ncbi:hypothetical protein ACFW04_005650 [Cataglyphis niger]
MKLIVVFLIVSVLVCAMIQESEQSPFFWPRHRSHRRNHRCRTTTSTSTAATTASTTTTTAPST